MTGEKIRQKRLALGWSQEELAHRLGYKDKTAINKIETGKNDVNTEKLQRFAVVLGCDPNDLLDTPTHQTYAPAHILAYAEMLSKLSDDARDNAIQYIRYLAEKGDNA